jgi:hypothetical protein
MKAVDYLKALLAEKQLTDESEEMKELRKRRNEVEGVLTSAFEEASPSIRYGGSKAKGTMVLVSFDLDLTCYFGCDDDSAGETLEEIYANVKKALVNAKYNVIEKTSAIRVQSTDKVDFHVDVVPGRFFDDTKTDVWLHRTSGNKERVKTNLDKHVEHVKSSGVQDAICLMKLWRDRYALSDFRTFALELLTIKLLDGWKKKDLDAQLRHVFEELRDKADTITIEDPANPEGNDLSELLSDSLRATLTNAALQTLAALDKDGWAKVFGPLKQEESDKAAALAAAVASTASRTKPWSRG